MRICLCEVSQDLYRGLCLVFRGLLWPFAGLEGFSLGEHKLCISCQIHSAQHSTDKENLEKTFSNLHSITKLQRFMIRDKTFVFANHLQFCYY
jgi:hypothetical protein